MAGSTDVLATSGSGADGGSREYCGGYTAGGAGVAEISGAEVTLTVDDAGMTPGADTYYGSTVLPIADAAGVPVGAAITVGYPLASDDCLGVSGMD